MMIRRDTWIHTHCLGTKMQLSFNESGMLTITTEDHENNEQAHLFLEPEFVEQLYAFLDERGAVERAA